ncbi:Pycsar system effector family protein [Streptomyces sp. SBT349]|uniref:Pycsar system effector family protein n=1 Tax=Streptomyces sp. SBT349 TaxID=1580539 RepID=UPI00066BBDB5|nr:Pycsar system effector family protein [Streptomyces sp. SBT349]
MSTLPTRDPDVALGEAYAEIQAQIARTDTKASILLAAIGAGLAVLGATGTAVTLPLVGGIAAGLSAAALAGAAGLLLAVIRPRLLHSGPGTLLRWASCTPEEFRADIATDHRAQVGPALARLAVAKYRRLQRAIDCIRAAGALLAVAALTALGGVL